MAGLYIHIPFCVKKCHYCDFYSIPYEPSLAEPLVEAIPQEAELYAPAEEPFETIYFGGGTPSVLGPDQIDTILSGLYRRVDISSDAEVTLEANPETLGRDAIKGFASVGVTRLSIGLQSLNDEELKSLGRVHDSRTALRALEQAIEVFTNVSVDIMYALPGQSLGSLQRTLQGILEFRPGHISAYELTLHESTPLAMEVLKGRLQIPSEETTARMYFLIVDVLKAAGYEHYEVSNYALQGYMCRHNLNYWTMGQYIGLGPSAHSFYQGTRWENTRDLSQYIEAVRAGKRPVCESRKLSKQDLLIETAMLGLRTSAGVALETLQVSYDRIEFLQKEGLLEVVGQRVKLTDRGMLLSNKLILELTGELWQ